MITKDKVLHIEACALIALFIMIISHLLSASLIVASVNAFICSIFTGLGKEYGDKANPYNIWDWKDILADCIGAICGTSFGILLWL